MNTGTNTTGEAHGAQRWTQRIRHFLRLDRLPRAVRKVIIGLAGGVVLIAGVIMLVTPGPAFIVIPAGLFILGIEFEWAKRAAAKVFDAVHKRRQQWRERRKAKAVGPSHPRPGHLMPP